MAVKINKREPARAEQAPSPLSAQPQTGEVHQSEELESPVEAAARVTYLLGDVRIVLVETQLGRNIGSAARAMKTIVFRCRTSRRKPRMPYA